MLKILQSVLNVFLLDFNSENSETNRTWRSRLDLPIWQTLSIGIWNFKKVKKENFDLINMSHHYTNPAFCQQSEFIPPRTTANNLTTAKRPDTLVKTQRSESMRSFSRSAQPISVANTQNRKERTFFQQRQINVQQRELPPKPGPKPKSHSTSKQTINDGYALVPLDELPSTSQGRYAVLATHEAQMIRSSSSIRLTKSQDDLDQISNVTPDFTCEGEDSFTSLPAIIPQEDNGQKLVSAFSTDFINKSMILVDQMSMQRYAIVPTDDDEEMVDSNHEIIQMHNGRAHRYAVIPTDEEETCLSEEFGSSSNVRSSNQYQSLKINAVPIGFATPPKLKHFAASTQTLNTSAGGNYGATRQKVQPNIHYQHHNKARNAAKHTDQNKIAPDTPTKNPIATQKLHELLSTPRKGQREPMQRYGSYHTIIQRSPNQYQSQILGNTPKQNEFTPQKLQYETMAHMQKQLENRTTAVISPRLHQSIYNETTLTSAVDKTWTHESFQKVENATATIGVISLMLILSGVLNSGLCLYMVTDVSSLFSLKFMDTVYRNFVVFFQFRCDVRTFLIWV